MLDSPLQAEAVGQDTVDLHIEKEQHLYWTNAMQRPFHLDNHNTQKHFICWLLSCTEPSCLLYAPSLLEMNSTLNLAL